MIKSFLDGVEITFR